MVQALPSISNHQIHPDGEPLLPKELPLFSNGGQLQGWDNAPNDKCYSSFGDRGTTATVNAYGNIIQFATPIKQIESGIAVADHACVWEPYCVNSRTSKILELSERKEYDEGETYGVCLAGLGADSLPKLTYVNYRWPRFDFLKNDRGISTTIQWVIFEDTVLQQYTVKNDGAEKHNVNFNFTTGMLIRDVDYLDPSHHFNDSHEGYTYGRGPEDSSWIIFHQLGNTDGYVAAVVSLFIDGKKESWKGDLSWTRSLEKDRSIKIVFAYKLLYANDMKPSSALTISEAVTNIEEILSAEPFSNALRLVGSKASDTVNESVKRPSGVPFIPTADHLEYLLRRNLEHILSVCAIPVGLQTQVRSDDLYERLGAPIVLTCGDVSFHRISTAASFFALQFLIESAQRICSLSGSEKHDKYAESLFERITTVCRGHLCWLLCTDKTDNGFFAANYWIRGVIMRQEWRMSWRPEDFITDTAFQLIKIKACLDILNMNLATNSEALAGLQSVIGEVTSSWLDDLEQKQTRGAYVWPHSQKADTKFYRLDDHVWIWKALKDINIGQFLKSVTKSSPSHNSGLRKEDSHRDVKQAVLRRFTTENGILRQRMLAVSRSSRDTRFLFHARDTVLFHARNWGFNLMDANFAEVWKNTIDVQKYHEENQETTWDNALRYALSISMACDGYSINRKATSDMVKGSLYVLVNSSSPNGLIMGQLDETSKKPVRFFNERDREFYFHASFEVPFILLTNATDILEQLEVASKSAMFGNILGAGTSKGKAETFSQIAPQPIVHISLFDSNGNPILLGVGTDDGFATSNAKNTHAGSSTMIRSMKKTIPFNNWVESRSVVEMADEWLFNQPSFFFERHENDSNLHMDLGQVLKYIEESSILLDASMKQAAKVLQGKQPETGLSRSKNLAVKPESLIETGRISVTVLDIAKKQKSKGEKIRHRFAHTATELDNAGLWERLVATRTADEAKKRFIWLLAPNPETALLTLAGSPKNEFTSMSLFFDRHARADQHFSEDTTMYLNTWETEIHLSFYQLVDCNNEPSTHGLSCSSKESLPGLKDLQVVKASAGYRFAGDFFDRYWTCHFVEYLPAKAKLLDENRLEFYPANMETPDWDFKFKPSSEDRSWTQRKVLELYLFERILTSLVENTREIFSKLQATFKDSQAEFAPMGLNERNYFLSSPHWQETQNSLKVIADRLEHTDDIIMRWESREKDRASEQPRWTRSDEGKHRGIIHKLHISTNVTIREFRTLHGKIVSFRESLITRQDQIRNEIALRGSENIRFFTYVTVVFLPLGFASSIFSMSDVPDHALVKNMVTFALVALILTVLAVISAQAVLSRIAETFGAGHTKLMWALGFAMGYSDKHLQKSFLVQQLGSSEGQPATTSDYLRTDTFAVDQQSLGSAVKNLNEDDEKRIRPDSPRRNDMTWHAKFWMLYAFIEFPAERVSLALEALQGKRSPLSSAGYLIGGVIVLPWWVLAFSIQFIALNVADMARFAWAEMLSLYRKTLQQIKENMSKEPTEATVNKDHKRYLKTLITPAPRLRPFKKSKENNREKPQHKME